MSLERVIKALVSLGLSRLDAEVYVYTAKKDSQSVMDLENALNYSKNQIYASLRTLIEQGLINKEGSTCLAIPFEEALELLIRHHREQEILLEDRKKELLDNWKKEE